jgi:hypothetical protein
MVNLLVKRALDLMGAERSARLTLAATCAPWVAILLFLSTWEVAVHLIAFVATLTGLGYLVIRVAFPKPSTGVQFFFSLPMGYAVGSSLIGISTKVGATAYLSTLSVAFLGTVGTGLLARAHTGRNNLKIQGGVGISVLSTIVCIVYFTPSVISDAVHLPDGGYQWLYVDTQYFMAIAASVKSGLGSVRLPGMSSGQLDYHFGPYALAGGWSALTGLELADSVARVARGSAQLSLVLSTVGLGHVIGHNWEAGRIAGIFGGFGLFFYGSMGALFAEQSNSSSEIEQAVLFEIPYMGLPISDGGPFTHIMLGHSVLHGLIGITAVLGVVLYELYGEKRPFERPRPYLLLPISTLLVAVNSVAGIGAAGIVFSLVLLFSKEKTKPVVGVAISFGLLVLFLWIMGYIGGGRSSRLEIDPYFQNVWWFSVFTWFFVGLGIRTISLSLLEKWRTDPASAMILVATVGFALFTLLINDQHWGNDRYGFSFLQSIYSISGFALLGVAMEKARSGASPWSWLTKRIARTGLWSGLLFLVISLVGLLGFAMAWKRLDKVLVGSLAVIMASFLLLHMPRGYRPQVIGSVVGICVLVGSFAWVPTFLNFGFDELNVRVDLRSSEVAALRKIREESGERDVIATNHHSIESIPSRPERSYGYRALSERPVLLEGWQYGEKFHNRYAEIKKDNESIFNSKSCVEVNNVLKKYNVKYIIQDNERKLKCDSIREVKMEGTKGKTKIYLVRL